MHILKKLALGLVSPLFVILLFLTAFDIGFVRTATHPATIKKLVADSGIYSSVVPSLLQNSQSISTSFGSISTSDPDIKAAANAVLSTQFIQQNTEMAIDNTYDWLNGKIAQPNFSINLADSKTLFANKIADILQARLSKLPACSRAQSLAIAQSGQFDAVNATCLPIGTSPAAVAEQAKSSLISQKNFLANTTVNSSNIKNGGSSQSIFNGTLKNAPQQYQWFKKTPVILGVLTILAGAAVVFLSQTQQSGLRHVGISLLAVGVLMLVLSWLINRTVSMDVVPKLKIDNAVLQGNVRGLITDLAQQVDKNYWFFGGLYSALGIAAVGSGEYFRRKSTESAPPKTHSKL